MRGCVTTCWTSWTSLTSKLIPLIIALNFWVNNFKSYFSSIDYIKVPAHKYSIYCTASLWLSVALSFDICQSFRALEVNKVSSGIMGCV